MPVVLNVRGLPQQAADRIAGLAEAVREGLREKGHVLKEMGSFGGTQAIVLEDGKFVPMTEPRVIERNREEAAQN